MTTIVFGAPWDAPICDDPDLVVVETPVGEECADCGVELVDGDNGTLMPLFTAFGAREREQAVPDRVRELVVAAGIPSDAFRWLAMHKECSLMSVAGHTFGVCSCTDYGGTGSRRAGALKVWQSVNGKMSKNGNK